MEDQIIQLKRKIEELEEELKKKRKKEEGKDINEGKDEEEVRIKFGI
jgi:hypothetical protein